MSKSTDKQKTPARVDKSDSEDEDIYSDEEGGVRLGTKGEIYIPPPQKPYCSAENKGPRLIITHITNKFFKSYAGTQVLGPFHKCFNAIVGPNGSGKSNVIDSMLFVFGYRASKIRSRKISVLLHKSENHPNVQSCTVSVHFAIIIDKEGDEYDVVPGSEFVVSRTAHRDNSSYYTLDGKRMQFKEIAVILKNHGIDLDYNRFLILQGEVEQISMMSAKGNENEPGMLEYLEDIIGTTRYKKPLSQLAHEVEVLSEARSEKLNRLNLVRSEMDELKEPMLEAVGFLKLENNIMSKRNFIYQKHIHNTEEEIKSLDTENKEIEESRNQLKAAVDALCEEKTAKSATLNETALKYQELEKRKESLQSAFDRANNKDIQLQEEMKRVNKNRKKTKELLVQEEKKLEEYQLLPAKTEKDIKEREKHEEKLSKDKQNLEEEKIEILGSMREQTKELQSKKEAIQTKLLVLNKIVDETKSALTLAESESKIYMSNYENEKRKLDNLTKSFEAGKETITQNTREVEKLKTLIPQNDKTLGNSNKELLQLKNEEATILGNIRKKRSYLEETRSSMQATRSRGRVLDSLMQQKREGKCPGLFGRLGDLGAIDSKYDVAVSTACGPLDNIVVDTVSTAEWCIEFLKKHDIGRGTFIALEKQQHLWNYCNTPIQTPENVPRLFDLIRTEDDRIKPAFYYGVRNTLVANTLDQGSRIAYGAQRHRVVTLEGALIETTGTMSGGGKQVSRGRMGQSVQVSNVNPVDLNNLESEVNDLEGDLCENRKRQVFLETQISNLQPELRQMKIAFEKFKIELESIKQQQPLIEEQLVVQTSKLKEVKLDPAKVKQFDKIIEEKKADNDKAMADSNVLQVKVDKITAEIKDKTQGKVQKIEREIKDIMKKLDKCKTDLTQLRVSIKTIERNTKKSAERIETMQQDITNAENGLRRMVEESKEIEEDAKKIMSCIEEISNTLESGSEEYKILKSKVDKLTKKENQLKADEIEIDQKYKTMQEKIDNFKTKIHSYRVKIKSLKLQEIPNEQVEQLKTYTPDDLDARDLQSITKELQVYEEEFKVAKPNLNAILEYNKKQNLFIERTHELEIVSEQRQKMRGYYDNLHSRRKEEFITGYKIIKMKLKEMYQMITLGGDADFEMLDTYDPFNEGIQFRVRPPKKTWKSISNLSGGEKTLSSLALVFALHYYKPSPLYVMDEIDAALDFKNVSIVGHYIKERTKNAQFIIISLRSNMFELCDYLIGIYKTFNCTKSVSIDPRKYESKKQSQDQVVPFLSETNQAEEIRPSQNADNSADKENNAPSVSTNA